MAAAYTDVPAVEKLPKLFNYAKPGEDLCKRRTYGILLFAVGFAEAGGRLLRSLEDTGPSLSRSSFRIRELSPGARFRLFIDNCFRLLWKIVQ